MREAPVKPFRLVKHCVRGRMVGHKELNRKPTEVFLITFCRLKNLSCLMAISDGQTICLAQFLSRLARVFSLAPILPLVKWLRGCGLSPGAHSRLLQVVRTFGCLLYTSPSPRDS